MAQAKVTVPRPGFIQVITEMDTASESTTVIHYQYGVRLPDGSHAWDRVISQRPTGTASVDLSDVASAGDSESWAKTKLNKLLTEWAESAHANVEDYISETQLVRRAVVLVVDAPEDF